MSQNIISNSIQPNLNILLYGDSILKGVIYDDIKNKYTLLSNAFANILKEKIEGTVINASRFGNTLNRALKRFYLDISKKSPNMVILEFGGNDCDYNWDEIALNPSGVHKPHTDFDEFHKILQEMVLSLVSKKIEPVLLTIPPIDSKRYFSWISKNDKTSAENILKWLGDVEKIHRWQSKYNQAILDVGINTKTTIIDIREAFTKNKDYKNYLCIDGIHPNEKGHLLISNKIEESIRKKYPLILKNQIKQTT